MKKSLKILLGSLMLMSSLYAIGYGLFNPREMQLTTFLLRNNTLNIIASTMIMIYLLIKSYYEMSKPVLDVTSKFKIGFMLTLTALIVINLMIRNTSNVELVVVFSVFFRYILLMGLLLVLEYYVVQNYTFTSRMILAIFAIVMTVLTLIYSSLYSSNELMMIAAAYYAIVVIYMIYLLFNWDDMSNRLKVIVFFAIGAAVISDIYLFIGIIDSIELTFIVVALGLAVIYFRRFYDEINRLKKSERYLNQYKRENERLINEKLKTEQSVEKFKSDISYKFTKKQNYYENLELILEVVDSSIIVMNTQYRIELAHGKIVEYSGVDDLVGLDITRAIFDGNIEEGTYFKSVIKKVFDAEDDIRENMYISLLDTNLNFNNMTYKMQYHILHKKNGEKVLIIDAELVNNSRSLDMATQHEKAVSDMLIGIVKNSEMFFTDLGSYVNFSKFATDLIDENKTVEDNIFKILRRVHTYKGVFDQYNMKQTIRALNSIETELFNLLHNTSNMNNDQLIRLIIGYDLEKLIDYDLDLIENRLGKHFLDQKKNISVDQTSLNRICIALGDEIGHDHLLIKDLESLKFVEVKTIIQSFDNYIRKISTEHSKLVDFVVMGDQVKVDKDYYINFFESLIHIFKNCIAHGVEYPDERRNLNKNETAVISCQVKSLDKSIELVISDDGRGIDIKEIKNRLFILGKYSIEELEALDDNVVCNMIIEDGVSSLSLPNNLAGKGVGMGSIKEVVEEIGGQITVSSEANKGVTYHIVLPKNVKKNNEDIPYDFIRRKLCIEAERILTKNSKKDTLSSTWLMTETGVASEQLLDVTSYTTVYAIRDLKLVISADEKFLIHLVNVYGLQMKYKGSNISIYNEALIMFSNDVTSKMIEGTKDFRSNIKMAYSKIIGSTSFEQYTGHQMFMGSIDITEGKLNVIIIN